MPIPARLAGIFLAATFLLGSAAAAPREYPVFHTDHPPAIDGDLREDLWRAVPWSGDFTGPKGATADVETQFAMAWDEKFLYVAVRCMEPKPERIHAQIAGRDPRIVNDDHIEILLAAAGKPDAFFRIFLNSGRGRMDQWIEQGPAAEGPAPAARQSLLEDAGLDAAALVHADSWVVEAAIPLPKVQFPLKEGVAYVGNICRVRPAGVVKEMAWSPAQRDLHTPADFGVFKLSGPAPQPRPVQAAAALCLRNGDTVSGALLGMADGRIRFSSPTFAEDASFDPAEILRLDLPWTESDAAPERFFLSGGTEISGRIVSLTADMVSVESPSLGLLTFPRALLSRIGFGGFSLESHFETGLLKPWEALAGTCAFGNGAMLLAGEAHAGRHPAVLSLPLHQATTVTFIADYDPTPRAPNLQILLFADRAHPQMQFQNGVLLSVMPGATGLVVVKDGQPAADPALQRKASGGPHAQVRMTYDPMTGIARAWYNGKQTVEVTAPDGPKQGEYVLFGAMNPVNIRRLAVYCGVPAPDDPAAGPKPGQILAALSNGDTVRASQVEFAGGDFLFTTEFGPMKLSPGRIASIAFPVRAEKPPAAGNLAWVETSGSRFPLQVEAITGDLVTGRNPDLGDIKLPRRIVKSIAFPMP